MKGKKLFRILLGVALLLVLALVVVGYMFSQKQSVRSLADERFQHVGNSPGYSFPNGNTTRSEGEYFVGAITVEKTPNCPGSPYMLGLVFKEENGVLTAHAAQLDGTKYTITSITPDNDQSSTYDPCFVRTLALAQGKNS